MEGGDYSLLSLAKDDEENGQQTEHFAAHRFNVMGEYHQLFRTKFKILNTGESSLNTSSNSLPSGSPSIVPSGSSPDLAGIVTTAGNMWVLP
eukprot:CAMPEP_0197537380 /NCGR_PEP_ID=MMETSP1318-20131121/56705_1 /TAXON_ID=552666 /ORGANISM="Partenskyella glossopodia, Strain RCC365" /LENGTH=91 /DNA_ID=CAMNT_0043095527 /DNA_START=40 /DNA_END=311 /DNA_ORIENTATION=-